MQSLCGSGTLFIWHQIMGGYRAASSICQQPHVVALLFTVIARPILSVCDLVQGHLFWQGLHLICLCGAPPSRSTALGLYAPTITPA